MKERLLMICYRAPYPLRSGSEIRMFQFLEILSERYDIDLLYLEDKFEEVDMEPMLRLCHEAHRFTASKLSRAGHAVLGYLFGGKPLQAGYFYSAGMNRWVRQHLAEYRQVLCMHVRTVQYVIKHPAYQSGQIRMYLDGIDAVTLNFYNSYQRANGIRKLVYGMEYRRMASYEKMAYSKAAESIVISERDRDYLTEQLHIDKAPHVVYNYAVDYGYQPERSTKSCQLAFMGKMNYAPNVDAIRTFVEKVFPVLKKQYPELTFQIIGGYPTEEILSYGKIEGVEVLGFVPDPAPILQESTMVIAPMVSGSGLQNKIIQAMYLACPVMTTPIGADGMSSVSEQELVIEEMGDCFTETLAKWLAPQKQADRRALGQRARSYVQKYYGYDQIAEQINRVFPG